MKKLVSLLFVSVASLAFSTAFAAEKLDLERTVPVPANEQIPIMDFFRPAILQQPKLNPSGTHIAAIITAAEDRHQVLVCELKTQKIEAVGGIGENDIYQVSWLNDRRLMFSLAARKLYGVGLFAADIGFLKESYPLLQYYGSGVISVPPKNRLRPLVWNRYDGLVNRRDLGVSVVNTDIKTGRFMNLLAAGTSWSSVMDARDSNERNIVDRYPLPETGLTYHYMTDRDGQLAFAMTAQDGELAMSRLVDRKWVKCQVDLEHIDIESCGDEPGQVVVLGPRQDGKPRALQLMDA
ncbi:MAG: hypothetical protein WC378_07305, partial [Opitutaceae bacterium]